MKNIWVFWLCIPFWIQAQEDERTGNWYMYFFNAPIKSGTFGIQGDIQYRNLNLGGDLEQLLIRSGIYYKDKNNQSLITLGFAHITNGSSGDSDDTFSEIRSYGEYLRPQKIGNRILVTHRLRAEARWIAESPFRDRFRYALFINVPINKTTLSTNAFYIAYYNELFLNGFNENNPRVFDRNRMYGGLGFVISKSSRIQLGIMRQDVYRNHKNQWQVGWHHQF